MVRGGRAEAPVPSSDVSFRLDQKAGNFKAAIVSRQMQRRPLTERKQKNQLAQTSFRFIQTATIRAGAITCGSSPAHQRCPAATDGTLQGGLYQQTNAVEFLDWRKAKESTCAEYRFIKTAIIIIIKKIIIRAAAITRRSSPLYQRCTAAKDGKLQGGLREQNNAVECVDWSEAKESTCRMKMTKIHEGQRGAGGNYAQWSRLLTASASAITWQSTETLSPILADSKMPSPPATRAAAAAYTREWTPRRAW
jgi:hypothetical protein